ncbi:acyltransferase family protein [Tersicoccus sp. MR15.9]|uniref:acyltransferase family protein n=1 Tax=Tersicoccus mangrovi TaxID=3121635 RepID=UPI002FE6906B
MVTTSPVPSPTAAPTASARPRHASLPGLDGLRALAVVLVMLYHLLPQWMPGGMVGVDVFFVLSGFLITSLLLVEFGGTGRIALGAFWLRRARRLLPAMLLVLFVSTTAAALLGGDVLVGLGRQLTGALTYTSNWLGITSHSAYFAQTSPQLLTHFWSLSVEEQFYVAWPLIVVALLLLKVRRRVLVAAAALAAVASAAGMAALHVPGSEATRVYFGTDTHSFGLMAGATLAFAVPHALDAARAAAATPVVARVRHVIGLLSLAGLVACGVALTERSDLTYQGGLALATLLTVGVVQGLLTRRPGILSRLLSVSPLRWIGRRSYGLYLWHWPVFVLLHYADPTLPMLTQAVIVVVLTVAAAEASYRWVERPVLTLGWRGALRALGRRSLGRGRKALPVALVAVAAVLGSGSVAVAGVTDAPNTTQAQRQIESGQKVLDAQPTGTVGRSAGAGRDVTVIGDSVTVASTAALERDLRGAVIDASVGRSMNDAADAARRLAEQGRLGRTVVVSLATNDEFSHDRVTELLDVLGPDRRLVLVTGFAPDRVYWTAEADRSLREAVADDPRITVADWQAAVATHTDWLASDGIHPTPRGQQLYADVISRAVTGP